MQYSYIGENQTKNFCWFLTLSWYSAIWTLRVQEKVQIKMAVLDLSAR